jgi:hypothetical protein
MTVTIYEHVWAGPVNYKILFLKPTLTTVITIVLLCRQKNGTAIHGGNWRRQKAKRIRQFLRSGRRRDNPCGVSNQYQYHHQTNDTDRPQISLLIVLGHIHLHYQSKPRGKILGGASMARP